MSFTLNTDYEMARRVREVNLDEQWPLPMPSTEQAEDTIWDCDWEETICPVCGHALDRHTNRDFTRCAQAA